MKSEGFVIYILQLGKLRLREEQKLLEVPQLLAAEKTCMHGTKCVGLRECSQGGGTELMINTHTHNWAGRTHLPCSQC
jgi:hypothetical protein